MNFNSGAFLLFLPAVTAVYWLLPHRGRRYWLLAASYFFYMYANPALILLLLASTAVDYCCGRGIERFRRRRTGRSPSRRTACPPPPACPTGCRSWG